MLVESTLLIIEDDHGLANLYKHIFELEGYLVQIATSAVEAYERLHDTKIDICLTDINMNGKNMLDMIFEHSAFTSGTVRFIVHSGDERYRETVAEHAMLFAGKPISMEALIGMVAQLTVQKRSA